MTMKFTRLLLYLALCIVVLIIGTLSYSNGIPNMRRFIDSQLKEQPGLAQLKEQPGIVNISIYARHAKQEDLIHMDNDTVAPPKENVFKSNVSEKYKLTSRSEGINYGSNHAINWTVLVTVNNGYWDFFLNWFRSYRNLNINYPIVAIAEDNMVYMKLKTFYSDIIHIEKSEFTAAEQASKFGSSYFNELVSQRPTHILKYITHGIDVLYADIDAVWLQNPFPYFKGNYDMWIQLDYADGKTLIYCTGLMAFRSNDATIQLIRNWEQSLQNHVEVDQYAFNRIIGESPVRLSVLDTETFPSGWQYFAEYTDVQRSNVVVVHNNWIVGHDEKLKRFQNMNLWFVQTDSDNVNLRTKLCIFIFAMSCVVVCAIVPCVIIIKRHLGRLLTTKPI